MAVHNGEMFLKEAIQSILSQSYTDFEFLIVNDCSSDQSENIILSFDDERIVLINNEKNLGLTKSLNLMLKQANGNYIARMDADDIAHPDRFKLQVQLLDENPEIGVCGSWYTRFSETEESVVKTISPSDELAVALLIKNQMGHPTTMMRKSVLDAHNIAYNEELITSQDYDLWLRLSSVCKLYNIPQSLLRYRIHENQVVHKKSESGRQYTHKGRMNFFQQLGLEIDDSENNALYKSYFSEPMSLKELQHLRSFFLKLLNCNLVNKQFVTRLLKKELDQRLKHCIRNLWVNENESNMQRIMFKVNNDFKGLLKFK